MVCMYVYTYAYIHVCIYEYTPRTICAYMHTYMHIHTYIHVHTYKVARAYTIYTYRVYFSPAVEQVGRDHVVRTYTHTYTLTYIHTCTHACIHT